MKARYVVFVYLTLAGCANAPHPLDCATGLVAWANCPPGSAGYNERHANDVNIQEDDETQCTNYGFTPGTVAFAQCRENLDINRMDQSNANNTALGQSLDEVIIANRPPPPPVIAPLPARVIVEPRSPVNCTTMYSGSMASTTCQ